MTPLKRSRMFTSLSEPAGPEQALTYVSDHPHGEQKFATILAPARSTVTETFWLNQLSVTRGDTVVEPVSVRPGTIPASQAGILV